MTASEYLILTLIIMIISSGLGYMWGSNVTYSKMEKQAIEAGCAEYNSVTGDWQWKDLPKPKEVKP